MTHRHVQSVGIDCGSDERKRASCFVCETEEDIASASIQESYRWGWDSRAERLKQLVVIATDLWQEMELAGVPDFQNQEGLATSGFSFLFNGSESKGGWEGHLPGPVHHLQVKPLL